MAVSDVKVGLDEIAKVIRAMRQSSFAGKDKFQSVADQLNALPTQFKALVDEIGTYSGKDAFENVSKAEFDALVAEYQSLLTKVDQVVTIDFTV